MIKLDLEKLNWVEDALIKWSNKLGRREIMLLEKDMYTKQSMAKRKHVKLDVDKPEDYFDFDENGNFVVNSKLLHLFIFFWDQKVEMASSKDATAFERHNEVDTGRAPSSQILYRPVLAYHSNVPGLCNGPVSTTSNTSNTHEHDFEEVNEIIEKCGCLSPRLWPKWICNNIDEIAKRATYLFPSSDPRNVLLFAAFKIHPSGKLGKILSLMMEAIDFIKNSRSKKGDTRKTNLTKFLEKTDSIQHPNLKKVTNSEIYNLYLHNNEARFNLAKELAGIVIGDGIIDAAVMTHALSIFTVY